MKKITLLACCLVMFSMLGSKPARPDTHKMQCGSAEHVSKVMRLYMSYKKQDVLKKKSLIRDTLHILADFIFEGYRGYDKAIKKLGAAAERELGCTGGRAWLEHIGAKFFSEKEMSAMRQALVGIIYNYYLKVAQFSLHGLGESNIEAWFKDTFEKFMNEDWASLAKEYNKPLRAYFKAFAQESFKLSEAEAESWADEVLQKHLSPEKVEKLNDLKKECRTMPRAFSKLTRELLITKKGKMGHTADPKHANAGSKHDPKHNASKSSGNAKRARSAQKRAQKRTAKAC